MEGKSAERVPLVCSCCGKQVMAYRQGDTLIITDRRHGERHTLVVALADCVSKKLDAPIDILFRLC